MSLQLELFPEFSSTLPAHSKIGASSMYRWSKCPGSVRLSKDIPSISSPYAEEGTKAHELAASLLENKKPNFEPSDEMLEAVQVYVDFVKKLAKGNELWIEHKFNLSKLYDGLFGTADAVVYNKKEKTLYVVDYKHGMGVPVEVENNSQLMYYALGALMSFSLPCETVEITVVQPRCPHPDGPIRKQVIAAFDLLDFSADLVKFAEATTKEDAPLIPGDHCGWCPAAGVCPEIHNKALAVAKEEFSPSFSYSPEKLAQVLAWVPTLKDWINNVMEFAYNEANAGRVPPGWKLVAKRATRKWKDEASATKVLIDDFNLNDNQIFKRSLVSVAQAEKLLPKDLKEKLSDLVVSESSGTTLVPDSDKRPARTQAEIDFTPVPFN